MTSSGRRYLVEKTITDPSILFMQNSVLIHTGQQKDIDKLHERIHELEAMLIDDPASSSPSGMPRVALDALRLAVFLLLLAGIRVNPRCS